MGISKIRKRDGITVKFRSRKIEHAIEKAMFAVGMDNEELLEKLTEKVIAKLNMNPADYIPSVEEIQDAVETVLISEGHARIAKAYILYRQKRAEIRKLSLIHI